MQEKLIKMGYKVWEKGDKKRIYINDWDKYLDVQKTEGGMGRGRIVNGISTENMSAAVQKKVIHFIEDYKFNGFKIYYDVNDESFYASNADTQVIADIVKTIIQKIKEDSERLEIDEKMENIAPKKEIDRKIDGDYEEFKGFGSGSKESYIYFQDLERKFIDIQKMGERSTRWVFQKFEWFPEGLYGEVINFQNGGDDYDYETIEKRRKFLLIGNKLDEMKINIQGQGWRDFRTTDLYKIFKDKLAK